VQKNAAENAVVRKKYPAGEAEERGRESQRNPATQRENPGEEADLQKQ